MRRRRVQEDQRIFWSELDSNGQPRLRFDDKSLSRAPIHSVMIDFLKLGDDPKLQIEAQTAMLASKIDQKILSGARAGDLKSYLFYCLIAPVKDIQKLMSEYPTGNEKAFKMIIYCDQKLDGNWDSPSKQVSSQSVDHEGMGDFNLGQLKSLAEGFQRSFNLVDPGGKFEDAFTQNGGYFNTDFSGSTLDGKITGDIVNHDFSNMTLNVRFGGNVDGCRFINTKMPRAKFYQHSEKSHFVKGAEISTNISNCTFINVDLSKVNPFAKKIGIGNVMRYVNLSKEQYQNKDLLHCVLQSVQNQDELNHIRKDATSAFEKEGIPADIARKIKDRERDIQKLEAPSTKGRLGKFGRSKSAPPHYSPKQLIEEISKYAKKTNRHFSESFNEAIAPFDKKMDDNSANRSSVITSILDAFASVDHSPSKDNSAVSKLLRDIYKRNPDDFKNAVTNTPGLGERLRSKNLDNSPNLKAIFSESVGLDMDTESSDSSVESRKSTK